MPEFDAEKAVRSLAYALGQALATVAQDDAERLDALERALIYQVENTRNPSARQVLDDLNLGFDRRAGAVRNALDRARTSKVPNPNSGEDLNPETDLEE